MEQGQEAVQRDQETEEGKVKEELVERELEKRKVEKKETAEAFLIN
jgi:hypothetical protein